MNKKNAVFVRPDPTIASLDSITPTTAAQNDSITITIYGTNTNFDKTENTVWLLNSVRQINAIATHPVDSITLEARFYLTGGFPVELYSIVVANELDGTVSLPEIFDLQAGPDAPDVTSVSPDTIEQGQTLDIKVTAVNIDFTQGTNVVSLKQGNTVIYMQNSRALSHDSLTATFSIGKDTPVGAYNLLIWNTIFDITLIAEQTLIKVKALYIKSGSVGINEILSEANLFFPNPASDMLYLSRKYEVVQIFNLNGRKVLESKQAEIVNISALPEGIYFIMAQRGNRSKIQKLIIQ